MLKKNLLVHVTSFQSMKQFIQWKILLLNNCTSTVTSSVYRGHSGSSLAHDSQLPLQKHLSHTFGDGTKPSQAKAKLVSLCQNSQRAAHECAYTVGRLSLLKPHSLPSEHRNRRAYQERHKQQGCRHLLREAQRFPNSAFAQTQPG